jgi:flagellar FliL protein
MADGHAGGENEPKTPRGGSGIMKLVKAIAFVSVIVLLEIAAAMAILPSAEDTRRIGMELSSAGDAGEDHDGDGQPDGGAQVEEDENHDVPPTREVSLGVYHVVSFNPSTGASMNIDFELFGVVLADDEAEFAERFLLHEKRMNEQVTIAIRGMQAADFTDPGLGLIKRIILEKVNRALGKTIVREAIFSEFSFSEH